MSLSHLDRYRTDPASFIDQFMPLNEKGQPWRLSAHQRKVLKLAFRWTAEGRLDALRHLIWGEMKKSGKTLLAAALGLWWAFTRPHTEVVCVANDKEQSIGRVFASMAALIKHNVALGQSAVVRAATILLSNGTTIVAISSDYTGEAGRRHSLAIYDEPWGIMAERARRLFEELTPPPTEPEAWVLMVTYAGFCGESTLLESLYEAGLQGERLDADLEVYRAGTLCMFWSLTPRQPWQTPQYYEEQRQTLRPNAFQPLHENKWVVGTEAFITGEDWDGCIDRTLTPELISMGPPSGAVDVLGADAGIKSDHAAVIKVRCHNAKLTLLSHRIWKPTPDAPLDIENTIEAYLIEQYRRGGIRAIVCDPYQLHRSITTLQRAGLPIRELPQTVGSTTAFSQALFDAIKGRNLRMYFAANLREQALNAVAVETGRGWRLAKEKASRKIDGMVALAMAVHTAIEEAGRFTDVLAYILPGQQVTGGDTSTLQALAKSQTDDPRFGSWWGARYYGRADSGDTPYRAAWRQRLRRERSARRAAALGLNTTEDGGQ
jgi:hypothetical protein